MIARVLMTVSLLLLSSVIPSGLLAGSRDSVSATAMEGYLNVNGTRLFYTVIGSGEPLVVVHGGPGLDHTYFLPQMEALAKTNKLIFFDQRASGRSSVDVDSNSMTMGSGRHLGSKK